MVAKMLDVESMSPSDYKGRWLRARRFLASMNGAVDPEEASLLAVHGVLAAADAFTIRHLGRRTSYGNHRATPALLVEVTGVPRVDEALIHLRHVLRAKGRVEDSDRRPRADSTRTLCDHARKFIAFVAKTLPKE